jgi:hypothetical protein
VIVAAIAPADDPPMLWNRYRAASSATAGGYAIPLVTPPFMTKSQKRSAGASGDEVAEA